MSFETGISPEREGETATWHLPSVSLSQQPLPLQCNQQPNWLPTQKKTTPHASIFSPFPFLFIIPYQLETIQTKTQSRRRRKKRFPFPFLCSYNKRREQKANLSLSKLVYFSLCLLIFLACIHIWMCIVCFYINDAYMCVSDLFAFSFDSLELNPFCPQYTWVDVFVIFTGIYCYMAFYELLGLTLFIL